MEINKAEIDGSGNIVIQNADNTTIIVNPNNPKELKQLLIDIQEQLKGLPIKIIELMKEKNTNEIILTGANIYLGLNLISNRENICGISFRVTITNLTKENRFFNAPFFKSSEFIYGNIDTFIMTDIVDQPIPFPKKLEYGEVVSQTYTIKESSKSLYEEAIRKNPNAFIVAIASTTLGEIYKSNEYKISQLLENFKYAK